MKDKQIVEMAKILRNANGKEYPENYFIADAKVLYRAGYHHVSEVARNVFVEINELKVQWALGDIDDNEFYKQLYKLEKKYTEGGE